MAAQRLPVVITAYNRPKHLQATLTSLMVCHEASEFDLFVYVDGAKSTEDQNCKAVREVVESITGFNSISVSVRPKNIGLAGNVISAVTEVMSRSQGAIVLEDDMLVNPNFLVFMNEAFFHYQANPHVGCITGYSPPIDTLSDTSHDLFASTRSSTWGWCMKADDWLSIDWRRELFEDLLKDETFLHKLNIAGNDRSGLLRAFVNNKLDIWGIRRGAWQVANNKLTLYPKFSMLRNTGLDGSGQNCGVWKEHEIGYREDFRPLDFPEINGYTPDTTCEAKLNAFYSR